jgi:hypothetical protein
VRLIVLLLVLRSLEGELSVVFVMSLPYASPTRCISVSMHIIWTRKIPASLKKELALY